MQSGFCTNCGQPLAAGAAFCASCGAHVEAPPAATATTVASVPPGVGAPGSNPPASFTPGVSTPPQQNQPRRWIGWIAGCLAAFLAVVVLFVVLLVVGILTHRLVLFAVGLGGLVGLFLIGAAIEHQIRRLYRRFKYGVERELGVLEGRQSAPARYRSQAHVTRSQPSFSPIRFLFSLAILAALAYGGLYLYYTDTFNGAWSGVLKIGTAQQGVQATLNVALPLHSPVNPSVSDPASLAVTQVEFKPTDAQACKGSPESYQLSGTASRLDAADVAMTLDTGKETIHLRGRYENATFTLSGKNARGQPVSLILEKGSDQTGYLAACK